MGQMKVPIEKYFKDQITNSYHCYKESVHKSFWINSYDAYYLQLYL